MMNKTEWIANYVQKEIQREIKKERERIITELEQLRSNYVFANTEQPVLLTRIITAIKGGFAGTLTEDVVPVVSSDADK